jgi:hypothetical protein
VLNADCLLAAAPKDRMLYAGSNLDKARQIFTEAIGHRPRIRLTIRQRVRVLEEWPREKAPKC